MIRKIINFIKHKVMVYRSRRDFAKGDYLTTEEYLEILKQSRYI